MGRSEVLPSFSPWKMDIVTPLTSSCHREFLGVRVSALPTDDPRGMNLFVPKFRTETQFLLGLHPLLRVVPGGWGEKPQGFCKALQKKSHFASDATKWLQ